MPYRKLNRGQPFRSSVKRGWLLQLALRVTHIVS